MKMTGEQYIRLPQKRVWEALNEPDVLSSCIPGCERLDKVSDTEYKVVITATVGPVKAKLNGKLLLIDLNPPNSYSLTFDGAGGAAGFGKGSATVMLSPDASGTKLAYTMEVTAGGKLAQVGSRMIDGVVRKMADHFFMKFNETIVASAAARAAPASECEPNIGAIWYGAAAIAIVIIAYMTLHFWA